MALFPTSPSDGVRAAIDMQKDVEYRSSLCREAEYTRFVYPILSRIILSERALAQSNIKSELIDCLSIGGTSGKSIEKPKGKTRSAKVIAIKIA